MSKRKRCANCKSFMYPDVLGDGYCAMRNKLVGYKECCEDFRRERKQPGRKAHGK